MFWAALVQELVLHFNRDGEQVADSQPCATIELEFGTKADHDGSGERSEDST